MMEDASVGEVTVIERAMKVDFLEVMGEEIVHPVVAPPPFCDVDPDNVPAVEPSASTCSSFTSGSSFCSRHSYPPLFNTLTSLPITLTFGCPIPQPSFSALPFSIPRLTALLLLLTLTTACAKLNLPLKGCSGIVYFNKCTANAKTNGARLVYNIALEIASSSVEG